ncbi:NLR family CARD domain-containing protein 3-like isoform X1 [Labrus bergylta]|uniref:NLR family CARD domain-containing protein 3-like isoform X1 n=1 Tax=Labrus bergylta TaxID=56723 RepID=UPI0033142C72
MAERRKKRKLSALLSEESEQPISTSAELFSDTESTAPGDVSMKSDGSMYKGIDFGHSNQSQTTGSSSAPSVVSMKSDGSMYKGIDFGQEDKQRGRRGSSSAPSVVSMKSDGSMYKGIDFGLKDKQSGKKPGKESNRQKDIEECIRASLLLVENKKFKEAMQNKFKMVSEGNGDSGNSLDSIFTALLITIQESEGPHEEHVFRSIKQKSAPESLNNTVNLSDIFSFLPEQKRTVLTKGVAGIGKSFTVQKLILDWAEGRENQDIHFIFCLAFREINLSKNDKSLHQLLTESHPVLHELKNSEDLVRARVVVILDGLDESRFELDFKNKQVTSVSEVTSVANLLANLIKGNLLPNAKLWITSRPAAADQIPAEFVNMVTEIRGFSDPQKEEYFRRRFSRDSGLADRIISHIHSSPSLDIMCQIPIFCWISAVLFKEIFEGHEKADIPKTLTEMMGHFLFAQIVRKNRKYYEKTEENKDQLLKTNKDLLLKLGKLAFIHLQKNNLIFYDEDLQDIGLDQKEAIIHSGFCTAVLREEEVFSQNKVFFFVHLTVQEFFAALYVYDCFTNHKTKELSDFLNLKGKNHTLLDLLKLTVEKVLEKKNGHLDFFMRFLLGLMVEDNRRVLKRLLESPDPSQDTEKKILTHLKAIRRTLPPESCISLFQTMVEMRDHKVKDEIEEYLRLPERAKTELTPLHCSALAYMLQVSKNDLELLDLKSFNTTDEGRRRLIPVVRISRKAKLALCKVTEEWVDHLAFGLKFPYLPLRDLDLSNNDLKDSGVKLLCGGLSTHCCRLKILRLSGCLVTGDGCAHLASALQSNPSHLEELDLSYNNLGEEGKKKLFKLRDDQQYKLKKINVDHGGNHRMIPGLKKYARELTFDPNTAHNNVTLSEGNRKATWEVQPWHPHDTAMLDQSQQVLCEQGLDGSCYWEIEALQPLRIGLMYKPTGGKGDANDCKLGYNDEFWFLHCSKDGCYVLHDNERISVSSFSSRSSRVGVYLDWPAGTLSFYKASSDSQTRLHTFKTTFNRPVYPAVELQAGSSALLCQLT